MTTFVLIADGVVVQKQPYTADGFIEAPDEVVPGWLYHGEVFSAPAVAAPGTASPQTDGAALAERQRKTAKDEAVALALAGEFKAAFEKVLELI